MPRFTVVIPLYNKESFILETAKSVLNQTVSDFELLIVNDSSTDRSMDQLASITDDRMRIIHHAKNSGLSASRNTGIKNANADYVAFLDADDLWEPTYLETMAFLIENYPQANMFACKYQIKLPNNKRLVYDYNHLNIEDHGLVDNFFTANLNQNFYYPSCLCVHKSVFAKVGLYDEAISFSEDVDFNIRAHARFKMAFSTKPLVVYTQDSENQITQSGLSLRTIPNYKKYEQEFVNRADIKKYLDFQRYVKAKLYKVEGNQSKFLELTSEIEPSNLSWKQRLLLKLPRTLLIQISKQKQQLLKRGVSVNSYQ